MQLPEIYFVRHGQTQANKADVSCGQGESDLTPVGVKQATESGQFLTEIPFKKVFVSPLRRTRQTYDAFCFPESIPVAYDKRLVEINVAAFDGGPEDNIRNSPYCMPNLWNNHDLAMPEGEGVNLVWARVKGFLEENVQGLKGPILIVSHGFVLRTIIAKLYGESAQTIADLPVGNASVWKLTAQGYHKIFDVEQDV